MSRSRNSGFQSLFSVSTQTDPVLGSTFGWNILVLNEAVGAVLGYVGGIERERVNKADENGVPSGPARRTVREVRSSQQDALLDFDDGHSQLAGSSAV